MDDESDEYEEEGTESEIREDVTDSTDISDFSGEDVEEEETENKSLVHKLKSKFQSLKKGKAAADDDEEEADDDEAAKKKKKSKIIQIVIGVMVVGFLLSDYILPPEEPTVAPAENTPKKLSPAQEARLKREAEAKKKALEAGTPDTADTANTAPENQPTDDTAVTTTTEEPAVDNTAVDTTVDNTVTDTPEDTTQVDTSSDTPVDSSTDTTVDVPTEDNPTESTVTASPEDTVIDTNTGETSPDVGINNNTDSIDGTDVYGGTEDSMTDQILEDLEKQARTETKPAVKKEYVAAPDYEYRGRGLVYNCTGKHWACVDAPSYKTCEDNSSSVKYLGKKTECYPFNVYETTRGCESMQNRMVSSSAKTNFCNE